MDVTLFPQEEVYKELYNNLEILPAPRFILEPMLDCIEEEMEDDLEEAAADEANFEELVLIINGNKKKKKKKKKSKKNESDFPTKIAYQTSEIKMQPNTIVNEEADHEEENESDLVTSRQPRQLAVRSNSLKRRDASWDHKWMEHLERNTPPEGDTLPRSSVFSRSPRQPGKVDRQVWEHRAAQDEVERLKRRTFAASPKPHHGASLKDFHSPSRTVTPVQAPPSPKPHYGASIKDYSPTRTETPPYPTLLSEVDQQQQKPLPSPPISIQTQNYQQQVDLPTPPPPLPPTEPDAEGWKEEMREEIWRARHSLLTGQDSQGVKSVIRLLEQTYDRLQHDDNDEATLLMSPSLPLSNVLEQQPITNRVENLTEKEFPQLSCVLDDDVEEEDKKEASQSQQQVIELSRSVSGTFHALPAEATYEEDIEGNDDFPEAPPNLAQDRKEFCQTMLAQNNDKVIEKVQQSKVTLMDEIHSKVQKIPAVDEVFKPNFIQLKDPLVDLLILPLATPNDRVQTNKGAKLSQTEESTNQSATHISQNLVKDVTKYVDESIQVITTKDEDFDISTTKEECSVIDEENLNELGGKGEMGGEVNSGGVAPHKLDDIRSDDEVKESTQSQSTSFKESIKLFERKPKTPPTTKWLQFETGPKREKVFSISGLWNKVSLGLVKERSTFWQGSQEEVFPFPSRQQQQKQTANAKRSSRLIDPNEWMAEEVEGLVSEHQQPLHKSVSMGQLDCQEEEEKDELLPVSQATVAFEARANGRKSADIFVQRSSPSEEKILEEQKECCTDMSVVTDNCEMTNETIESPTTHQQMKEETYEHVIKETSFQCSETKEICSSNNFQSIGTVRKNDMNSNQQTISQSLVENDEIIMSTQQQTNEHAIEQNALPPQVPGRHSSKKVLREKMQQHQKVSSSPKAPPVLTILNVETTNSEEGQRAKILAQYEVEKQKKIEEERKARQQCEQENKFYQKMETAERYRQHQSNTTPSSTPTPYANEISKKSMSKETKRLERIKTQELKERMKLKEMERRKRDIEEEIMKEKEHLAQLLMLEKLEPTISGVPLLQLPPSPPPPPVPPRPRHCFPFDDEPLKLEEEEKKETSESVNHDHQMSFTETFEDLENTTLKLKEMAEKKAAEQLKETAGVVRDVAQVLLQAVDSSKPEEQLEDEVEEDMMTEGYSEGAEDFSCGVELPFEQSSGNVTPVPTQGELEEIDTSNSCSPRRTPLKSLLKKGWENDETLSLPEDLPSATTILTMRERSNSPRKAVHFSEVDQIKLMSQESLVSTAPSEHKNDIVQSSPSQTCSASRMKAKEGPCRNQLVSS